MTGLLAALLAVLVLTDPGELGENAALGVDRDDVKGQPVQRKAASARITSRAGDFDRAEGVAMFEGDVVVRYGDDYVMHADKIYVFLAGSNELSRIVAAGRVSITNETRVGTCSLATFRRRRSEIEMFWDGADKARLVDRGASASELEGARIKFWIDSEQVEVDDSQITLGAQGKEMKLL